MEDLIQKEDMVVTVTLSGYIKRVPLPPIERKNVEEREIWSFDAR